MKKLFLILLILPKVSFGYSDTSLSALKSTGMCIGLSCDLESVGPKQLAGIKITDLSGANLMLTDFSGMNLSKINFTGANMTGAKLDNVTTDESTNFKDADLSGASLQNIKAAAVNFSGASLYGANLSNGHFEHAIFVGAGFGGANIDKADFKYSHLLNIRPVLGGTKTFKDSTGKMVTVNAGTILDLRNVKNINTAHFEHADLTGALLSGINFETAYFAGSRLNGAHFENAVFGANADLSYAQLQKAFFSGAQFKKGSVIARSNFSGSNFYQTTANPDLYVRAYGPKPTTFDGVNCWATIFDGANLTGSTFTGGHLQHTSFKYATLVKASLGSNFEDAVFDHAKLQQATLKLVVDPHYMVSKMSGMVSGLERRWGLPASGSSAPTTTQTNFGSNFTHTSFKFAQMQNVILEGASFNYANFYSANMQDATISGVMSYTNLGGAYLKGAKIYSVYMDHVTLDPSSWENLSVNLLADFTGTKINYLVTALSDYELQESPSFTDIKGQDMTWCGKERLLLCNKNRPLLFALCKNGVHGACSTYCEISNNYYADIDLGGGLHQSKCFEGFDVYHLEGDVYEESKLSKCAYFSSDKVQWAAQESIQKVTADSTEIPLFKVSKCSLDDNQCLPIALRDCSDVVSKTAAGTRDTVKWTKHTVSTGYDKTKKWLDSVF